MLTLILAFTALMSVSIFLISTKGWQGSDYTIRVFAISIAIILGISNLINSVVKPKTNYINYYQKADISEKSRFEIIRTLYHLDEVKITTIDSIVNKNYEKLGTISETLSTVDDSNISTSELLKNFSFN